MTAWTARRMVALLVIGLLWGVGLGLAGLANAASMASLFRDVLPANDTWRFAPLLALAVALLVAMAGIRVGQKLRRPVLTDRFAARDNDGIDRSLIAGATLMGIGWGLSGYVPVTALAALAVFPYDAILFLIGGTVGVIVTEILRGRDRSSWATARHEHGQTDGFSREI